MSDDDRAKLMALRVSEIEEAFFRECAKTFEMPIEEVRAKPYIQRFAKIASQVLEAARIEAEVFARLNEALLGRLGEWPKCRVEIDKNDPTRLNVYPEAYLPSITCTIGFSGDGMPQEAPGPSPTKVPITYPANRCRRCGEKIKGNTGRSPPDWCWQIGDAHYCEFCCNDNGVPEPPEER